MEGYAVLSVHCRNNNALLKVRCNRNGFFPPSVFRTRIRSSKSCGEFVTDYLSIITRISGTWEHPWSAAQLLWCCSAAFRSWVTTTRTQGFLSGPNSVRFVEGHPVLASGWCVLVVVDWFSQVNWLQWRWMSGTLLLRVVPLATAPGLSPAVLFVEFPDLEITWVCLTRVCFSFGEWIGMKPALVTPRSVQVPLQEHKCECFFWTYPGSVVPFCSGGRSFVSTQLSCWCRNRNWVASYEARRLFVCLLVCWDLSLQVLGFLLTFSRNFS